MTIEVKSKVKVWLEHVFRFIVTAFITLVLITAPNYMADIKTLTFDNIEDKVNTKNHINSSLTVLELRDLKTHISNPDFHMSRLTKDSLYVTRLEFEQLLDRLAITNYQTKEQLIEINALIRAINNKL